MAAVEIEFECGVPTAPHLQLPDEGGGPVMVAEESDRLALSTLLNSLLNLTVPVAFEFIVTVAHVNGESHSLFILTSLKEFMERHKLSAEQRLKITYILARQPLQEAPLMPSPHWVMSVASCDDFVAAACSDGLLRAVNLNDGTPSGPVTAVKSCVVEKLCSCPLTSVVVHNIGNRREVVLSNMDGDILFCGMRKDGSPCVLAKGALDTGSADCVAVVEAAAFAAGSSSDINIYASYSRKDHVDVDVDDRKRKRDDETDDFIEPDETMKGHRRPVLDLCPTADFLLSASLDSTVRVWDLRTAQQRAVFGVSRSAVSVSANNDSNLFATCSDDRRARIWDMRVHSTHNENAAAALRHTFTPFKRHAALCRWNPHNSLQLAVASHDGTLTVFDLRAFGDTLQSVHWEGSKLLALDWLSDKHLVCGGTDGQLRSVYVP